MGGEMLEGVVAMGDGLVGRRLYHLLHVLLW
jgi:hypothetical protein